MCSQFDFSRRAAIVFLPVSSAIFRSATVDGSCQWGFQAKAKQTSEQELVGPHTVPRAMHSHSPWSYRGREPLAFKNEPAPPVLALYAL